MPPSRGTGTVAAGPAELLVDVLPAAGATLGVPSSSSVRKGPQVSLGVQEPRPELPF